jgi:hypothetical protein
VPESLQGLFVSAGLLSPTQRAVVEARPPPAD